MPKGSPMQSQADLQPPLASMSTSPVTAPKDSNPVASPKSLAVAAGADDSALDVLRRSKVPQGTEERVAMAEDAGLEPVPADRPQKTCVQPLPSASPASLFPERRHIMWEAAPRSERAESCIGGRRRHRLACYCSNAQLRFQLIGNATSLRPAGTRSNRIGSRRDGHCWTL